MRTLAWALLFALPLLCQPSDLELFLLIGQSNMAGRGAVEAEDKIPIPGVYALTKELQWAAATDPIHFDKPIAGVGLARSFARHLRQVSPAARIGLIPAAFGGTSLEEWSPGGKLCRDAVARAKAAMKSGRLRGILWHQGEAECGDERRASSYGERFVKFITALRAELGTPDVPVVVGQLGEFLRIPHARVVNEQLASIPLTVKRAAFVSSQGLAHKGDDVHFDSVSLREFGRRYALAYQSLDATWDRPAAVAPAPGLAPLRSFEGAWLGAGKGRSGASTSERSYR